LANILFLGPLSSVHADNFIYVLNKSKHNIFALNIRAFPYYKKSPRIIGMDKEIVIKDLYRNHEFPQFLPKVDILLRILTTKFSKKIQENIKQFIIENDIDLIFSWWGIVPFPEILAIQKQLEIPIIHNFETFPVSRFKHGVMFENEYCKKGIEHLDGRMYGTKQMEKYMEDNFNCTHGKNIIFNTWLSERVLPKHNLNKLSEFDGEPHIVFIGNTTFKRVNDIRPQLKQIIKEKIHIHLSKPNNFDIKSKYIHTFDNFSYQDIINGDFTSFLTQFDASIVLFKYKQEWCKDRYLGSTPGRFLFSMLSQIPIILPAGMFQGCQQIVEENKIGFTYSTIKDLNSKLIDVDIMSKYTNNAEKKSKTFTFESNSNRLNKYFKSIMQ
jgi:hypothetical protein